MFNDSATFTIGVRFSRIAVTNSFISCPSAPPWPPGSTFGGSGGRSKFGEFGCLPEASATPSNDPQFLPSPVSPSKEPSSPRNRPLTPSWPALCQQQSARNEPPSLVRYIAVSVACVLLNLFTPGFMNHQSAGVPWHDTWVSDPPVTPM